MQKNTHWIHCPLLISRVGRHNVWKSTNKVSFGTITLVDSNANVSNVDLYSVKSDFFWWFLNTSWAALLAKALKKSISLQKKKKNDYYSSSTLGISKMHINDFSIKQCWICKLFDHRKRGFCLNDLERAESLLPMRYYRFGKGSLKQETKSRTAHASSANTKDQLLMQGWCRGYL